MIVAGQVVRGCLHGGAGGVALHAGCGGVVPPKPVGLHGIAFFVNAAIRIHDLHMHFGNLGVILRLHDVSFVGALHQVSSSKQG